MNRQAPSARLDRLVRDAADAAQLRAYQTDPDVIALRVERVRNQVDLMCWTGIILALAFTMTNVQGFAARDAQPWSLPWLAAWLLDPMVSLVLVAILRAEQITAKYQVPTGPWVRRAKWFSLAATYVMNCWASYAAGAPSEIVLHSVPPLIVFVAAEAITDLRDKLTEAATKAAGAKPPHPDVTVHEQETPRRRMFADYLSDARSAWSPGVTVTPAWVRQVTGCSRGLSPRLAKTLADEIAERGDRP